MWAAAGGVTNSDRTWPKGQKQKGSLKRHSKTKRHVKNRPHSNIIVPSYYWFYASFFGSEISCAASYKILKRVSTSATVVRIQLVAICNPTTRCNWVLHTGPLSCKFYQHLLTWDQRATSRHESKANANVPAFSLIASRGRLHKRPQTNESTSFRQSTLEMEICPPEVS